MKICVINGSPKGKLSVTFQTALFLREHFQDCEWAVIHAGQRIRMYEKDLSKALQTVQKADLLLFSYPVYTFLAPWQLHRFIELLKEQNVDLSGKFATQITTSKHFYDVTAHRYIEQNCQDMGLKYIRGLSADMGDLAGEKGQKEALDFWRFVRYSVENDLYELPRTAGGEQPRTSEGELSQTASDGPSLTAAEAETDGKTAAAFQGQAADAASGAGSGAEEVTQSPEAPGKRTDKKVILLTNAEDSDTALAALTEAFRDAFPFVTETVNIAEFPFAGGCLGCLKCAADGTCVYKDGFSDFLRSRILKADAVVYAFTIKDHSMGASFKIYDDRQFCNGHRTMTMGMPVGYLIVGDYAREDNVRLLIEARAEVGHNYFAGAAQDAAGIRNLSARLTYALDNGYVLPQNFYGVGGMKIFRDLIYVMRGMMRADHAFYKKQGFYDDMPQKQAGTIAGMWLVGSMLANPKLAKKMSGQMSDGMLMPYRKVLREAHWCRDRE